MVSTNLILIVLILGAFVALGGLKLLPKAREQGTKLLADLKGLKS